MALVIPLAVVKGLMATKTAFVGIIGAKVLGISVTGNMCAGATAACIVCLGGDVLITLARAQLRVMKCMADVEMVIARFSARLGQMAADVRRAVLQFHINMRGLLVTMGCLQDTMDTATRSFNKVVSIGGDLITYVLTIIFPDGSGKNPPGSPGGPGGPPAQPPSADAIATVIKLDKHGGQMEMRHLDTNQRQWATLEAQKLSQRLDTIVLPPVSAIQ